MTSTLSREQDPAEDITPNFDVFLLGKKDVAKAGNKKPICNQVSYWRIHFFRFCNQTESLLQIL
jgi:hypothetical protein